MKIIKIEILTMNGDIDRIFLHTELPTTFPQIVDMENMQMIIHIQHGTGLKYIMDNFGNDPMFPAIATVIDGNKGTREVVSISEVLRS